MERLSKSELKRRHKQIEAAAREVAALNDSEISRLGLSDEIADEVKLCRGLKGSALKRQLKYVAKLLKQEQIDDVLRQLALQKGSKLEEAQLHHQAERLRDTIINEALEARDQRLQEGVALEMDWPSETIDSAVQLYPEVEELELRRSAYQYVKTRNKVHSRELFRILRSAADKSRFSQR